MSATTPHEAELADRRREIVSEWQSGRHPENIAHGHNVSLSTVYRDLRSAGIVARAYRCARDGNRAQPPEVKVDGKTYLLCDGCRERMQTYVGVEVVLT